MSKKIVVYGKNGQLGTALAKVLGEDAVIFANSEHDFSLIQNIKNALEAVDIKAVINATAYTNVNKAEEEEELANKANCEIPKAMAGYCKERDVPFIHFSTDYVFPGEGDKPYKEDDKTSPLNAYGRSKLAGEEAVAEIGGKYLIFRTSWVYNATHPNFLNTMLKLGADREELSIVADQFGAPSYAPHLAMATKEIIDSPEFQRPSPQPSPEGRGGSGDFPSGIYHMCGAGETSWHGFASAIFDAARTNGATLKIKEVKPISSEEFPTPAKRPKNSRLDCSKLRKTFDVSMPSWEDGLKECFSD